ncbi:hypothetical protein, partial [Pseudoflavonifractor phocaeensis]|uniref:hypothetical protein n=1 Tax=Pseudoflavonifractor phocaeensis TaxID=1870988 RepID=UPI0021095F4F
AGNVSLETFPAPCAIYVKPLFPYFQVVFAHFTQFQRSVKNTPGQIVQCATFGAWKWGKFRRNLPGVAWNPSIGTAN